MKRFRRTPWRFQKTFLTPLKDIDGFVTAILSSVGNIGTSRVIVDQVVFDAKHLEAISSPGHSLFPTKRDVVITADDPNEVKSLLIAAFSDWIDFAFIPTPKSFIVYCDHDEYTTFYSNASSRLSRLTNLLLSLGYKMVENWDRTL